MSAPKFRAWDKVTKQYYPVSGLELGEDGELCEIYLAGIEIDESSPNANVRNPSDIVLEQDTGLKDRDGREICEGDILKVEDDEYTPDTNKFLGYNAIVKASISKGGAFTVKNWWGEQILNWDVSLSRVEVIGNINENPELLEEEE